MGFLGNENLIVAGEVYRKMWDPLLMFCEVKKRERWAGKSRSGNSEFMNFALGAIADRKPDISLHFALQTVMQGRGCSSAEEHKPQRSNSG